MKLYLKRAFYGLLKAFIYKKLMIFYVRKLSELDEMIKNNSSSEDDLEAKKDMEYFLEELQTILKSIDNNQINDKEAEEIYENKFYARNA